MRILVTGASGFIGSAAVRAFSAKGYEVAALMRPTSDPGGLAGIRFERRDGTLGQLESLKRALQGMDAVVHLAGAVTAPNEKSFLESNAHGTKNLALAAAEAGVRQFIYVSSLAAGGPSQEHLPRTEDQSPAPVSAYGRSKLEGERVLEEFVGHFQVRTLRPPIVYGPRDRGLLVLARGIARGVLPVLKGSGAEQSKFYSAIYVDDLVELMDLALKTPADPAVPKSNEIFYASGEGVHRSEDLLGAMVSALGKKPFRISIGPRMIRVAATAADLLAKIRGKSLPFGSDKAQELLPDYWVCSNEKARRVLKFEPRILLPEGIETTMRWYQTQGWI